MVRCSLGLAPTRRLLLLLVTSSSRWGRLLGLDVHDLGTLLLQLAQLALLDELATLATGLSLFLKHLLPGLLGLVDVLDEKTLVLEHSSLGAEVELVVQVPIDLLCLTVLGEQAAEHPDAAHPQNLAGQTSLLGTLAPSETAVPSLSLGEVNGAHAGAGVHGGGLADHQTILDELLDSLARVCHGDLRDLIRVEPNLLPPALKHRSRKPLLQLE